LGYIQHQLEQLMTLEEKLLSLKIEGFYLEESVLSPTQAAEAYVSTKATLKIGADNWSVDAEEEGLENRHNFQVTTT